MNQNALILFHELMKKGWISRDEQTAVWNLASDPQTMDDLTIMGRELGFDLVRGTNRLYLVPTQDNDLFLKNNMDFRKDIGDTGAKVRDIYLMNYLAVFTLYEFFRGEGDSPLIREYISRDELIADFTRHAEAASKKDAGDTDTSDVFRQMAESWLAKKEGKKDSLKQDERQGILSRLIIKFKADELFTDDGDRIRPTQKLKDLMPYVLRKERAEQINRWIAGKGD